MVQPDGTAAPVPSVIRMARRAARAAGLVYGSDDHPGYARQGAPGAFRFADSRGRRIKDPRTLARVKQLAIPPAWKDVWINPHPRGHLQASGRDSRGRKQYLYHADWRTIRDSAKFDHLVEFALTLPKLRRAVQTSLKRPTLDRERVTAVVVRLLETSLIRIGNEEYARVNNSYGLTTLQIRHAEVRAGRIRFKFRGKSGLRHRIEVPNPDLARIVRQLQDLPGQELFCYVDPDGTCRRVKSDDVNAYLREHSGTTFTAKDFRTWAGTVLAALTLAQMPVPDSKTELKRTLAAAVRSVAERLGNTPAVARRSYIHPAIFELFAERKLPVLPPPERWPSATLRIRLAAEEQAVLRVLRTVSQVSARQPPPPLRISRRVGTDAPSHDPAIARRSA